MAVKTSIYETRGTWQIRHSVWQDGHESWFVGKTGPYPCIIALNKQTALAILDCLVKNAV